MKTNVFKFKMTLDGNDDFARYYEIKSSQTFLDFFDLIKATVDFDSEEIASFYICDSQWRKQKEITLLDMSDPENKTNEVQLPVMKTAVISDFIEEPRQKIILIYDFIKLWTFFVELIRIVKPERGVKYPRCTRSEGILPKEHVSSKKSKNEFEDLLLDDEFFDEDMEFSENEEEDDEILLFEEDKLEDGFNIDEESKDDMI